MKLNDSFMRHFRWLTPLLLTFSIYMLQDMYREFKDQRYDLVNLKSDMAYVKGFLAKEIKR